MIKLRLVIVSLFLLSLLSACSSKLNQPTTQLDRGVLSSMQPGISSTPRSGNTHSPTANTPNTATTTPQIRHEFTNTVFSEASKVPPELSVTSSPPSTIETTWTPEPTSKPTSTPPLATQNAIDILEAIDAPCQPDGSKASWGSGVSPNGEWVAILCLENSADSSYYLKVFRTDSQKEWRIYYKDYSRGLEDDNALSVFHWSLDGKYVYATAETRASGCCWPSWDILLVRLNLKSGQQTAIVNYTMYPFRTTDFSFSPDDRYLLYFGSPRRLIILDLQTWQNRVIHLRFDNPGWAGYARMSPDNNKVIVLRREYPDVYEGDLTYGSLLLINLVNGSQVKLLSGMEYHETPIPYRWQDDKHVVLRNNGYWILNIENGDVTEFEGP